METTREGFYYLIINKVTNQNLNLTPAARYDEAFSDFDRARKLEPRNTEFELGYQNCKEHLAK